MNDLATYSIELYSQPLDPAAAISWVTHPACGGIDVFVGTVREATNARAVTCLEFEAYEPMALSEMRKIAGAAAARWPVQRLAIWHRLGTLQVGELAVVIAVTTPHRAAAFAACQFLIDTLKESVPIWKKEVFADGEVWVAAHP